MEIISEKTTDCCQSPLHDGAKVMLCVIFAEQRDARDDDKQVVTFCSIDVAKLRKVSDTRNYLPFFCAFCCAKQW